MPFRWIDEGETLSRPDSPRLFLGVIVLHMVAEKDIDTLLIQAKHRAYNILAQRKGKRVFQEKLARERIDAHSAVEPCTDGVRSVSDVKEV